MIGSRLIFAEYNGLNLDEVLEGVEVMPVRFVARATPPTLPPLIGKDRERAWDDVIGVGVDPAKPKLRTATRRARIAVKRPSPTRTIPMSPRTDTRAVLAAALGAWLSPSDDSPSWRCSGCALVFRWGSPANLIAWCPICPWPAEPIERAQ